MFVASLPPVQPDALVITAQIQDEKGSRFISPTQLQEGIILKNSHIVSLN